MPLLPWAHVPLTVKAQGQVPLRVHPVLQVPWQGRTWNDNDGPEQYPSESPLLRYYYNFTQRFVCCICFQGKLFFPCQFFQNTYSFLDSSNLVYFWTNFNIAYFWLSTLVEATLTCQYGTDPDIRWPGSSLTPVWETPVSSSGKPSTGSVRWTRHAPGQSMTPGKSSGHTTSQGK